jgi:hypothetical protein
MLMNEKQITNEENKSFTHKDKANDQEAQSSVHENGTLPFFQQQVGNRAVQRLLAQRSGDGPFDLDDETADRINRERGDGQALDSSIQTKMNAATGQDFSNVKVHTGPESHALNESLSAKAFTTGHDIFFREGAYDPGSSSGQELLAHELTHVVQQSSGRVGGGGGRMTVNAPGDAYEQEADSVARAVTSTTSASSLQRQEASDEEAQTQSLQRQEMEEEDEENG